MFALVFALLTTGGIVSQIIVDNFPSKEACEVVLNQDTLSFVADMNVGENFSIKAFKSCMDQEELDGFKKSTIQMLNDASKRHSI